LSAVRRCVDGLDDGCAGAITTEFDASTSEATGSDPLKSGSARTDRARDRREDRARDEWLAVRAKWFETSTASGPVAACILCDPAVAVADLSSVSCVASGFLSPGAVIGTVGVQLAVGADTVLWPKRFFSAWNAALKALIEWLSWRTVRTGNSACAQGCCDRHPNPERRWMQSHRERPHSASFLHRTNESHCARRCGRAHRVAARGVALLHAHSPLARHSSHCRPRGSLLVAGRFERRPETGEQTARGRN
jgi:hypothetical protein